MLVQYLLSGFLDYSSIYLSGGDFTDKVTYLPIHPLIIPPHALAHLLNGPFSFVITKLRP